MTSKPSKSQQFYDKNHIVVTPYNSTEYKGTLDDAIRKMLTDDLHFKESHAHADLKLVFGYIACAFAGFAAAYSYIIPFPACKPVLAICVTGYFVFNSLMMLYAKYVEKDVVYVGTKTTGASATPRKIVVKTNAHKYSADYTVTVEAEEPVKNAGTVKKVTYSQKLNYGQFFDVDGLFVFSEFHEKMSKMFKANTLKLE